ncbi:uncharacterized protein LOC121091032 [Falco naumanni]|uniref:uncharacterized protein LOC121091032 n=1 Tax=Falco naumanni TaxID=148594 RepID=UPI001ADE2798|nr:uncharacterized protein LOC121091032 [Falco naumanni]
MPPRRVQPGGAPRSPSAARLLPLLLVLVGARPGLPATSDYKHSLNPNSSLWDADYERLLLHSKKSLSGTMGSYKPSSLFRSSSLLGHQGRRSLLSQNLSQKPQEKQLSCDMLLTLSRYILVDTFGPSLAWNLFRFYNCDREVNLPKIPLSPLKVAQHKVKPFLLHRVLRLLRNMGVLSEVQQSKAFSLLKKQILKPRTTLLKPEEELSGKYVKRRYGVGISNALWCWLSGAVGPGSVLPRLGAAISGCNPVRGGPVSPQEPALSVQAELEPWLRVLSPKQGVCDETGGTRSLSAEEEMLDKGWYGVRRAAAAHGPL